MAQCYKRSCLRATNKAHTTFTALVLKFPILAVGFDRCQVIFNECDTNRDNRVSLGEMLEGLQKQGFEDHELITKIFQTTDFDGDPTIDIKEFVAAMALLYISKKGEGEALDKLQPSIVNMFQIILDAFFFFDTDSSGTLHKVMAANRRALCPSSVICH